MCDSLYCIDLSCNVAAVARYVTAVIFPRALMMVLEWSLTLCDHALQSDDVGVVELSHDAGLSQEVPPLTLCVAAL